jgi:flagellar protein FliO/FliZ
MDIDVYLRFLAALLLVLALIAGFAWAARKFGLGGALPATKSKTPRLSLVEVKVIDSRRKLVLLRRDGREHLVLLGPSQDLLIEGGLPIPEPRPDAAGPATPTLGRPEAPAATTGGRRP